MTKKELFLAVIFCFCLFSAVMPYWMEEMVKSVGIVEAYRISAEEGDQIVTVTSEASGWVVASRIISGVIAIFVFVLFYRQQKRAR